MALTPTQKHRRTHSFVIAFYTYPGPTSGNGALDREKGSSRSFVQATFHQSPRGIVEHGEERDTLMAKQFRVTFALRASNKMNGLLLRAGVKLGSMVLLTVRGRKSGQPHTTPVALNEDNGQRYLIAPYGNVNWARNLRAASSGTIRRGRRTEQISTVELSAGEAAPILKHSLAGAPSYVLDYYDVKPDSSLEAFESEAPRHPVFRLRNQAERESTGETASEGRAKLS